MTNMKNVRLPFTRARLERLKKEIDALYSELEEKRRLDAALAFVRSLPDASEAV